jgi:hypothetical protein
VRAAVFLAGDVKAMPSTLDLAVQRQRDVLLRLATDWAKRSPLDADANEALAYALEIHGELGAAGTGGRSALDALRAARRLSTNSDQRFRLAMAELRVLVKQSEFEAARLLADSLLATPNPTASQASQLAGVAALTGRAGSTAMLLRRSVTGGQDGINGVLLGDRAPERVRALAADLAASAVLGVCDSVWLQAKRVEDAIETYVEPNGKRAVWEQILPTAYSRAAPCDGGRALLDVKRPSDRLMLMQQSYARRDFATLRRHFAVLGQTRKSDRPGDVAIDYTVQEAWLLAATGDTAAAISRLEHALSALPTLGDLVVESVSQAAALGRALKLRVDLSRGSSTVQQEAAAQLVALWRDADSAVRGQRFP